MEPISLAALAVGALTTLANNMATGTADRVLSGVDRIAELVRKRLGGDPGNAELVDEVTTAPTESSRERLTLRLAQKIMSDPSFGEELEQALESSGAGHSIQAQDTGIAAGGDVRLEGEYVAGRDLQVGTEPRRDRS